MAITTAGWTTNKSIAETYAASLTGGAWSNYGELGGLLITTPAEAYYGSRNSALAARHSDSYHHSHTSLLALTEAFTPTIADIPQPKPT